MREPEPKNWPISRLKYIADCNRRVLAEDTDEQFAFTYVDIGNVDQGSMRLDTTPLRFAEAPSRARRIADPGDIVISTVRTYLRAVAGVPAFDSELPLIFSTGFAVLHPRPGIHSSWLAYYLQSDDFIDRVVAASEGVSYPAISALRLMSFDLRVPPLPEQRAIADFLDRETGQIDRLIERQEQLIATLQERRVSCLEEATSAADGEWIRLRYLFRPSSECNAPDEEVLSVYRYYGVIPKSSRTDNFNRTPENVERYLLVRPGDLVINRMKAWQGSLGVSQYRGIVSGDYEVVRPVDARLDPAFVHVYLRSPRMIAEYRLRSTGVRPAQWRLYWDEMGDIEMPVPALETQRLIVQTVNDQTGRIDVLIERAERFIGLARERRAALVSAAVTGRVDVRGVA